MLEEDNNTPGQANACALLRMYMWYFSPLQGIWIRAVPSVHTPPSVAAKKQQKEGYVQYLFLLEGGLLPQ